MVEIPEHLLERAKDAMGRVRSEHVPDHLLKISEKHSAGMGHSGLKSMKVTKITAPTTPASFRMIRRNDETGISGNGCVLEGVLFSTGKVVVNWLSDKGSVVVWDSLEDFLDIHINSHPANRSLLVWSDGTTWEHDPEKEQ